VEARGGQPDTFFSVTVARALDNMASTEMVERVSNGVRVAEQGRWNLLRENGAKGSRKFADDFGVAAR
jgi:hypothetical protein